MLSWRLASEATSSMEQQRVKLNTPSLRSDSEECTPDHTSSACQKRGDSENSNGRQEQSRDRSRALKLYLTSRRSPEERDKANQEVKRREASVCVVENVEVNCCPNCFVKAFAEYDSESSSGGSPRLPHALVNDAGRYGQLDQTDR